MSNNLNGENMLWLIGTGNMAIEYAKVLKALKVKFLVIILGSDSSYSDFQFQLAPEPCVLFC